MLFLELMRLASAFFAVIRAIATTIVGTFKDFKPLFLRQVGDFSASLTRLPTLPFDRSIAGMRGKPGSIL